MPKRTPRDIMTSLSDRLSEWNLLSVLIAALMATAGLVGLVSGIIQILQYKQPWLILLSIIILAVPVALLRGILQRAAATRRAKQAEEENEELDTRVRHLILTGQWFNAADDLGKLLSQNYREVKSKQETYLEVLQGGPSLPIAQDHPDEPIIRQDTRKEGQKRPDVYWQRPSLVIGLGESGFEVLCHTKERFEKAYGTNLPSLVQFLSIDTSLRPSTSAQRSGASSNDPSAREVVNLGIPPIADIIANIDIHPWLHWLEPDIQPNLSLDSKINIIRHSRKLGRLAVFYSLHVDAKVLLGRLGLLIDKLRKQRSEQMARKKGVRTQDGAGLDIFVVSASWDNVGSGMKLDIACLIHHHMHSQAISRSEYQITGIVMLPEDSTTTTKRGKRVQANSYAFLQELDYHMKSASLDIEYPNARVRLDDASPFRDCYLVKPRGEKGQSYLSQAVGESIFLQVTSELGWLLREGRELEPGSYSAMGAAADLFPAHRVTEVCSVKLALHLVERSLGSENNKEDHPVQRGRHLALDTLSGADLHPQAVWTQRTGIELPQWEQEKTGWDAYSTQIREVVAQLDARARARIEGRVRSMIRSEPQGLVLPLEYLHQLGDHLAVLLTFLREERENVQPLDGLGVEHQRELHDALAGAVESILSGVVNPMHRALRRSSTLLTDIDTSLRNTLEAHHKKLAPGKGFERYRATSLDSLDTLYSTYAPTSDDLKTVVMEELFDAIGYPYEWGQRQKLEVERGFLSFCRVRFERMSMLSIEDVSKMTVTSLKSLMRRAQPLWEGDIPENAQHLVTFGVGELDHKLYRKNRNMGRFIQTHDKNRVSCLTTAHDLELSDLVPYLEYSKGYHAIPRLKRAYVHCFPALVDDDKEKLTFAQAHALGLVKQGTDGTFWLQAGEVTLEMGQDLATALKTFLCQQPRVVERVGSFIEEKERKEGTAKIEAKLVTYVELLEQRGEQDNDTATKLALLVNQHLYRMQHESEDPA